MLLNISGTLLKLLPSFFCSKIRLQLSAQSWHESNQHQTLNTKRIHKQRGKTICINKNIFKKNKRKRKLSFYETENEREKFDRFIRTVHPFERVSFFAYIGTCRWTIVQTALQRKEAIICQRGCYSVSSHGSIPRATVSSRLIFIFRTLFVCFFFTNKYRFALLGFVPLLTRIEFRMTNSEQARWRNPWDL